MKNYRPCDPREDAGYFIVFEHINEAAELLFNKAGHSVIAEVLSDKMQKVPCFVGYDDLQKISNTFHKNLTAYLLTSQIGTKTLASLDLLQLKSLLLKSYPLYQFELLEMQHTLASA
jgi:hypothetical protein